MTEEIPVVATVAAPPVVKPEVIRVAIGSEPVQCIFAEVLKSSILRRTTRPVEFYESWDRTRAENKGWHNLCVDPRHHRTSGTLFSHWRWIVPELLGRSGKAIYLDSDQAVFGDIGELYDYLDADHTIAAVIGAEGYFGDKPPGSDTIETSVMVINLDRCKWSAAKLLGEVKEGKMPYGKMMQATWMDRSEVFKLPHPWNHFNIHEPGRTKLTHWTKVREQPSHNIKHKTAKIWEGEIRASLDCGHLDPDLLRKEIKRGNLDPHYMRLLK